jgi:hypothetical protein
LQVSGCGRLRPARQLVAMPKKLFRRRIYKAIWTQASDFRYPVRNGTAARDKTAQAPHATAFGAGQSGRVSIAWAWASRRPQPDSILEKYG